MAQNIDYQKEVQESVKQEFDEFRADMLTRTKEEIFNNNYGIRFYTELHAFLTSEYIGDHLDDKNMEGLYQDKGAILSELYSYYLHEEYSSINNWGDTADLVRDYNERYYSEIVNREESELE